MQYVLMIHVAESRYAAIDPVRMEAMMQDYGAYTRRIVGTGRAGDCAALEATTTATTVRVRDGKRVVKDGPFAEAREQLGGYYVIDAESEEEALEWAAQIPGAKLGTIEVRPLVPNTASSSTAPAPPGSRQYLLLIYEAEARWATMPEEEQRETLARYAAFGKGLREAGQLVGGARLGSVRGAKAVSVDGAQRVVKDGPFAEMREQLGGYYRVHAKNLDEAIALAARIPAAEAGAIEVRPVADTSKYA